MADFKKAKVICRFWGEKIRERERFERKEEGEVERSD